MLKVLSGEQVRTFCTRKAFFISALFFLFLFALRTPSHAQFPADTLDVRVILSDVTIEASRLPVAWKRQPVMIHEISRLHADRAGTETLGQLLDLSAPVFIRDYGGSGASSVSSRGFSPRHTQFVWNGFVMNHSMLGQADLNILPVAAMENIRVAPGNASASYGGSGVAGSILADSRGVPETISVYGGLGRWRSYESGFSAGLIQNNFRLGIFAGYSEAANDFRYFDVIRQRDRQRENNANESYYAMINGGYHKNSFRYDASLWFTVSDQELSGSVTSVNPSATQFDRMVNLNQKFSYTGDNTLWSLNTLLSRVDLDYHDRQTNSTSTVNRFQARLENRFDLRDNFRLLSGFEGGLQGVQTNNYNDLKKRNTVSFFSMADLQPVSSLSVFPSVRLDYYNDFGSSLNGALGLNWNTPWSPLSLRGQISNNYSPPTLNDLYWAQGGNPDLLPEESRTIEGGISLEWSSGQIASRTGITLFRTDFENGIQWRPGQGGVWTPVNFSEIDSRGMEMEQHLNFRIGQFLMSGYGTIIYNQSTSPISAGSDGQSRDKQLPYVPEWNVKTGFNLSWKYAYAGIDYQYAGDRYTTSDHSSPLDPLDSYGFWQLSAGLNGNIGRYAARLDWSVKNLTDREFQIIAWYPMPPRHHQVRLTINFNYRHNPS